MWAFFSSWFCFLGADWLGSNRSHGIIVHRNVWWLQLAMTSYCKVPDINTEVRKQAGVTPHHNNTQGVDPSGHKCHLVHVQFHEFIVVAPRSSLPHSSASPPSSIGCLPSSGRGAVFSLLIPPTLVSETNSRNNRANTSSTSEIWVKAGNNRAFAWWRHLTTTTRMLWGKLLYSVLFVKNRSCVTQICITKIAAKCILVVAVKWLHRANDLFVPEQNKWFQQSLHISFLDLWDIYDVSKISRRD